jgi:hypothetical protein
VENPLRQIGRGPRRALHRLPETVAHVAEALWLQAIEESRRRLLIEQRDTARIAELDKQRLEVRSHVLTLREGELDSRLRDRDRTIEVLQLQVNSLTGALRKEQATRELQSARAPKPRPRSKPKSKIAARTSSRRRVTAKNKRKPSKRR